MNILTGKAIKEADKATLECEQIESLELMERASEAIAQWLCNNMDMGRPLLFVIGKGNNAGDGLAVARMACGAGFRCAVALLYPEESMSSECAANLRRLPADVHITDDITAFVSESDNAPVIVDAILGTGCSGKLYPEIETAITEINAAKEIRDGMTVVSIDLPSGMTTEFGNDGRTIVEADHTLTLGFPKLSLLLPEAGDRCGHVTVLDIGLDSGYIDSCQSPYSYITADDIPPLKMARRKFGHKGSFGHALLIAGSECMAGAAVLAAGGALRSGCGLVTVHIPHGARSALNANYPSAITSLDSGEVFSSLPADLDRYQAIGVGCGLGQSPRTVDAFEKLLRTYRRPMVIDADALNIIAANRQLETLIPPGSVLTPHPGELRRLTGGWQDEEHKLATVAGLCRRINSTMVVKGAHTIICSPDGTFRFNSTGNPGMAKGGSGDVLTGLITGLIARGYTPPDAAILGVYYHGVAGDKCAGYFGAEAMNAGDLPDFIAEAMNETE